MHTYTDDRGHSFMSIFDHLSEFAGQFNASTMLPGAVKAWHRHALQDDHWVVLKGHLKIGLFNTEATPLSAHVRLATPTPNGDQSTTVIVAPNSGKAVFLGERRAGILHIPAGLWHGGVAFGEDPALLLYYVTRRYDPARPDEERKPWDAFNFEWTTEHR